MDQKTAVTSVIEKTLTVLKIIQEMRSFHSVPTRDCRYTVEIEI